MDRDSAKGKAKQAAGKLKETAGKVTGNEKTEARGQVDQMEGRGQEAFGDAKQGVKNLSKKVRG